ncbi:hypothetical protein PIB30_102978 [Stylosanthes scabra]|uniref:Uncharacterized protein n=1 Tax=Stylosanthes scabra TaxID=79078 RepID=A0ABU6ZWI2_9FABA|nr:hypothetical protein [Stylosanthes scabra]
MEERESDDAGGLVGCHRRCRRVRERQKRGERRKVSSLLPLRPTTMGASNVIRCCYFWRSPPSPVTSEKERTEERKMKAELWCSLKRERRRRKGELRVAVASSHGFAAAVVEEVVVEASVIATIPERKRCAERKDEFEGVGWGVFRRSFVAIEPRPPLHVAPPCFNSPE